MKLCESRVTLTRIVASRCGHSVTSNRNLVLQGGFSFEFVDAST